MKPIQLAALAALSLVACQSVQTTAPGEVGVSRQQTMLVSSGTVNKSADKAYRKVISEAQQKGQLNRDAAQVSRVRSIAARLIPQAKVFRPDALGWNWEVNVITSKQVNAWCMPGGKIAFYTGLIEQLRATDDEIAAVMGHEMAHALREHGRERASQAMAQGIGIAVVGTALGVGDLGQDLSQLVLDLTFNLPNSRTAEIEADRIGVEIAARGGYDPRAAITLWEKMQKAAQGQPPQFLSTHPSHGTRIADLRAYAAKVLPLYESARAKR
ncbi:MAG: M48 family metallopeptidase [Proteobacteria bacterium]|nr:M48 family metallopeptidase [Pseudomonadota bacterium]MDA0981953.1 M48 family metallopeptidase [Pseudomonadota bacterium]